MLEKAESLARKLHAGQLRKGTKIPYVSHPLAVAELVRSRGGTEAQIAAALLHDAIEDGPPEAAGEVLEACGTRVLALVRELSKPPALDKLEWAASLKNLSPEAALVAASDKLHNMASIVEAHGEVGAKVWERFKGGRARVLAYYEAVVAALPSNPELRSRLEALKLLKEDT